MVNYVVQKLLGKVFGTVMKILIDFVVAPIVNITYVVVVTSVSFFLYNISTLLLSVMDFLFDMFRMFAGVSEGLYFNSIKSGLLDNVDVAMVSNDLLIQMVTSEEVLSVFASVFLAGVFLVMVSSFVAIIKQEFNMEKANNKGKVIAAALKSLINMILVPAVCIMGMIMANMVLKVVDTATGGSENLTISGVIFSAATIDAYYGDKLNYMVSIADPYDTALNGGMSAAIGTILDSFKDLTGMKEEHMEKIHNVVQKIFGFQVPAYMIENNNTLKIPSVDAKGNVSWTEVIKAKNSDEVADCEAAISVFKQYISEMYTYKNYHYINEAAKGTSVEKDYYLSEVQYAGWIARTSDGNPDVVELRKVGTPAVSPKYTINTECHSRVKALYDNELRSGDAYHTYRVYYNAYQVTSDFHPARINYFILIVASATIITTLFHATIGLMMRVYQGAALFIILPGVIGISPLDEGGAFNRWKSQFISQVVGAYSAILAVNLFLMLCGWFMKIQVTYVPSNVLMPSLELSGITYLTVSFLLNNNMLTAMFRMLFIITGAFMIKDMSKLLAEVLGLFDVTSDGASMANSLKNEFGKVASIMAGTGAAGAYMGTKAFKGLGKVATKSFKTGVAKGKGISANIKDKKSRMSALMEKAKEDPSITDPKKWAKDQFKAEKKLEKGILKGAKKSLSAEAKKKARADKKLYKAGRKYANSKHNKLFGFAVGNFTGNANLDYASDAAIDSMKEDKEAGIVGQTDEQQKHIDEASEAVKEFKKTHGNFFTRSRDDRKQLKELKKTKKSEEKKYQDIVSGYLDDTSKAANMNLGQRIIDANQTDKAHVKANMKWGFDSLKDMLPGIKTLKDIKEGRKKAESDTEKTSEYMEKMGQALEEMAKDEIKDKDKKENADFYDQSASMVKRAVSSAFQELHRDAVTKDEEFLASIAKAIMDAYEKGQKKDLVRYANYLEQKGYEVDANKIINEGKLDVFNKLSEMKIDFSAVNNAKTEKEILKAFKNIAKEMADKNQQRGVAIMKDIFEKFKDSMDGK